MSSTANSKRVDIDTWIQLAESDPEKFEAMRAEAIERVIASSSKAHRERLRCLQWRIDKLRERSATPMAATIAISRLMWDSFYQLHDRYQELAGKQAGPHRLAKPASPESAEIIKFRPIPTS